MRACEVAGFDRKKKLIFEKDMIRDLDKIAEDAYARRTALEEGLAKGRAEGIAEGIAKGEAKGQKEKSREIAANLLTAGLPISQIASCTGLSEEEVMSLRRS